MNPIRIEPKAKAQNIIITRIKPNKKMQSKINRISGKLSI